jgi:hypothetical protein
MTRRIARALRALVPTNFMSTNAQLRSVEPRLPACVQIRLQIYDYPKAIHRVRAKRATSARVALELARENGSDNPLSQRAIAIDARMALQNILIRRAQ